MFETEYKYLVEQKAAIDYLDAVVKGDYFDNKLVSISHIEQFYIVDDSNAAVRVRIADKGTENETRTLTIKSANAGAKRIEIERELSAEEADALRSMSISTLNKTRYTIDCSSWLWEFDVFHDKLAGRVYAEIEVNREDDEYEMPRCEDAMAMADGREHSNAYLASLTAE